MICANIWPFPAGCRRLTVSRISVWMAKYRFNYTTHSNIMEYVNIYLVIANYLLGWSVPDVLLLLSGQSICLTTMLKSV